MRDVRALLEARAEETPDRVYLVCPGEEVTWSQLNQRVDSMALGLQTLGVSGETGPHCWSAIARSSCTCGGVSGNWAG